MANKQLIIDADYPTKFKVLGLIQCISHEMEAVQARILKPFGISNTQLMILHELDKHEEGFMTVNDIKARMVDDSPNVSRSLSGLEKMKLIKKTKDKSDKRVVIVSITDLGRKIHHDVDEITTSHPTDINLSDDEIEVMYQLLSKL